MLGLIFKAFISFAKSELDENIKDKLFAECKITRNDYHETIVYPDTEFFKLFSKFLEISGREKNEVLESFGKKVIIDLIDLANKWKLLKPTDKSLEILQKVRNIHKAVLMYSSSGTNVPLVDGEKISGNEVKISYQSDRGLAHLVIGIIKGLAEIFNENLDIIINKLEDTEAELIVKKV